VGINNILVVLAALDGTNGTTAYGTGKVVTLTGAQGAPTGAGATAKTTLQARGVTVNTLSSGGVIVLRAGYAWNGPSGPTFDTKNFMRGSVVHDAFYQLFREKLLDLGWRETADSELKRMCREDGMSWVRAWWVHRAVRFGGESSATWQDEKVMEAP